MDAQSFPSEQRGRGVVGVPRLASDVDEMVDGIRELLHDMSDRIVAQEALLAERPAAPAPALLALAKLGAWFAQSHADEPGDVWACDIENAEDRFGVVIPTTAPAGRCAAGGLRDDSCRCTEFFHDEDDFTCRLFAPGIADAIAALLAPGGAGQHEEATDGD